MSARCGECGKFRKPADLAMVYTGGPAPEPDHEACANGCRPETHDSGITEEDAHEWASESGER